MSVGDDLNTVSTAGIDVQDTMVGGSASFTAGTDGATFNVMSVGDELTVDSAADLLISTAAAGGAADIQTQGDLSVTDSLVAGGPLTMMSSGLISGEYVESGASAVLEADDQITIDTLVTSDDLSATATGIGLQNTTVGGSADLAAGADGAVIGMFTAENDVFAVSAAGVQFDLFSAGGLVDITAVENVGGSNGASAQITAGELSVNSTEGAIAGLGQPLEIDVSGDVSLDALGDIGVHAINSSDLMASRVVSQSGSIDLRVSDGSATLGRVSAPEDITIETTEGLTADEIDGADTVNLAVSNEGGEVAVDKLGVETSLVVMADVIDLPNVVHLGDFLPLKVDLTGNDGGLADSIEFVADTSVSVDFINFKTSDFELKFTSDLVSFTDMEIGEFGRLVTPRHDIVIDNVNRVLYPSATTQLYAFNEPFDLTTTSDNLIFTTARLVDYNPLYTVNQFSTENSLVRLSPKRLTLWGRLVRDLTSEPLTTVSPEEDVISIDSGGFLMIEGMPPISMQLK